MERGHGPCALILQVAAGALVPVPPQASHFRGEEDGAAELHLLRGHYPQGVALLAHQVGLAASAAGQGEPGGHQSGYPTRQVVLPTHESAPRRASAGQRAPAQSREGSLGRSGGGGIERCCAGLSRGHAAGAGVEMRSALLVHLVDLRGWSPLDIGAEPGCGQSRSMLSYALTPQVLLFR